MEPGEPAVHAGHLHRIAKAQLAAARAEDEAERAEKELREAAREDARQTEELSMRRAASGHYSRQVRPAGPWSKVSDAQQHTLSRLQVEEETSQAAADAATARHAEAVQWSEEAGEKNRTSAEALDHVEASEIPLPTIYVSPDDKEWLAALMWARTAMQQGELDDALAAERAMTEVERTDLVDARLVGGPDAEICYVCADSERSPSESLVRQAMSWARENPDWEPPSMEESLAACMSEKEIRNPKYRGEELDHQSLQMVFRAKAEVLVDDHIQYRHSIKQAKRQFFSPPPGADPWDAIETTVLTRHQAACEQWEESRQPPRENSAKIARYNPNAHFNWGSKQIQDSECPLQAALARGQIKNRPVHYFQPGCSRLPLELSVHDMGSFDVEGDLVACCGDLQSHEIRSSKGYVGFFEVPQPVSMDVPTLGDIKDSSGRLICDTNCVTALWKARRSEHRAFRTVLAEGSSQRVWAAGNTVGGGKRSEFITCFDTESKLEVATLGYPGAVSEHAKGFVNFSTAHTRCGNRIVGCGSTSELYVWDVSRALQEFVPEPDASPLSGWYGADLVDDMEAETDDDEQQDAEAVQQERPAKRAKKATAMLPSSCITIETDFEVGLVQQLSDQRCLVAPQAGDTRDGAMPFSSLRVVDLEQGKTSAVLTGHQEAPVIDRQLCAASHQLVFSVENRTGCALVFDLRTCSPVFLLPQVFRPPMGMMGMLCGASGGILGVPTPAACVAFTWGDDECIRAWDLRKPSSFAYTLSTGNLNVTSLGWHERTASLFAATRNEHALTYGRNAQYQYGERCRFKYGEEEEEERGWPKRAQHKQDYFPEKYHVDCEGGCDMAGDGGNNRALQYTFAVSSAHEDV